MHGANFDDEMSGTTAINVGFKDGVMYISNLGDSRAIVAVDNGGDGLVVQPLSFDQTPYRKVGRRDWAPRGLSFISAARRGVGAPAAARGCRRARSGDLLHLSVSFVFLSF